MYSIKKPYNNFEVLSCFTVDVLQAKNEPGSMSSKTGPGAPKKPDEKSTSDKTGDKKEGGRSSQGYCGVMYLALYLLLSSAVNLCIEFGHSSGPT